MDVYEQQELSHKHHLSMKRQEEALASLELTLMDNRPPPPTPNGYTDARWRAVVKMLTRRYYGGD
jgi:hypothetical protein